MKRKLAAMMALALSFSVLVGCSPKDEQEQSKQLPNSSSVASESKEQPQSKEDDIELDQGDYGFKTETIGPVSFTYDSDILSIARKDNADSFALSLFNKENPTAIPQVNLIGINTADLEGKMSEDEYANLCQQLLQQYYVDPQANVEVKVTTMNFDDPEQRVAEAVLYNNGEKDNTAITAKMKLIYNNQNGVMAISLMGDSVTDEDQAPFEAVYQSVSLKK